MLCLGVGSDIGLLRNPSTTQPAFAVIVSVIRGESEGNTTCKLKVKPLIIKRGSKHPPGCFSPRLILTHIKRTTELSPSFSTYLNS